MRLTIAIPTFNRNQILLDNLRRLLPQLNDECRLVIIDNCSDVPVADTLSEILSQFPQVNVEILRNRLNVGLLANVARCFEVCETEWLWALGDDDAIEADAIEIILQHIAAHPQCLYFNFCIGSYAGFEGRKQVIMTRGARDFVEKVDSIANVLFLSSGVYNARAVAANLKLGYTYAYSQQPNFIALLTSLGKTGVCCLSNRQIMTYESPPPGQIWSFVSFGLGIMTLLELELTPRVRRRLAQKIVASLPRLEYFVVQLLLSAVRRNQPVPSVLYLYDQLCFRLYYFDTNPRQKLKIFVYRQLLRFPRLSYGALRMVKGDVAEAYLLADRFERT